MTSIGSRWFTASSAWTDLQNWHAKMKAAGEQFADNSSGLADALLGSSVTQSQGLGDIIAQQVIARLQNGNRTTPLTGGNTINGPGDVYQDPGVTPFDPATMVGAPVGGPSSAV